MVVCVRAASDESISCIHKISLSASRILRAYQLIVSSASSGLIEMRQLISNLVGGGA